MYCTKIGATHPEEMYIVGAHMDGIGWGEAANDDGSGTALVMEIARVFSSPDVMTDRSIRFALWNNEETGLNGARAYVDQRKDLQGKEDPPGSGKYPEPKWLGMIQHDMMMFDHGMPRKDGTVSEQQRPEADVNIEFQSTSKFAGAGGQARVGIPAANEKYATDYPAVVGQSHDEYGFRAVSGSGAVDQPARTGARLADRRRLGSDASSAHRRLLAFLRRRFPAGPECHADHAGRHRAAGRREVEVGARRRARSFAWPAHSCVAKTEIGACFEPFLMTG